MSDEQQEWSLKCDCQTSGRENELNELFDQLEAQLEPAVEQIEATLHKQANGPEEAQTPHMTSCRDSLQHSSVCDMMLPGMDDVEHIAVEPEVSVHPNLHMTEEFAQVVCKTSSSCGGF